MSNIEYEGKILDVNVDEIVATIQRIGGKKIGDYTFRRYVFDVLPPQKNMWLRLRTNGVKTTLALKQIAHDGIDGTSEWEITVSDFDTTLTILQKSGLTSKSYQENRRLEFELQGATLSVDYWPRLSPYLEIEATSKKTVENIAERLGFSAAQLVGDNTKKLYAAAGIDLDKTPKLAF